MKILLVTTKELTGLNYHRQFTPHAHLQDKYGKDVYEYSKCYSLTYLTDEEIAAHDIVSFHRIAENPAAIPACINGYAGFTKVYGELCAVV